MLQFINKRNIDRYTSCPNCSPYKVPENSECWFCKEKKTITISKWMDYSYKNYPHWQSHNKKRGKVHYRRLK